MEVPQVVPERGFYYHYKHDPNGVLNNYAYEVIGVGAHTENDCRPEDMFMVVYRPIYSDAAVFKAGKLFDLRPLEMWMGNVELNGAIVPRFRKITNTEVIAQLRKIKKNMYRRR